MMEMSRIDLVKLRKIAGMSQRDLADLLQVRPSFLSAIENGKSRLPEEKLLKIKEIFEIDDLEPYTIDDAADSVVVVPPHTHPHTHGHAHAQAEPLDSLTQLLNHFHDLAHRNNRDVEDPELAARIDFLTKRNDRLSDRLDDLRDEVDTLRAENLRLKELLIKAGVSY